MNTRPHNLLSYGRQWDQFYSSNQAGARGPALWDVAPERAAARDYSLFSPYFTRSLPIVDFGCGTGRQTAFLARLHGRAIGLDVSGEAIRQARGANNTDGVTFLAIDESEPRYFERIHADLGDANVYVRGVLHQLLDEDLPRVTGSLRTLMGSQGRLFFIEVACDVRDYLTRESGGFSRLPEPMKRTLISRLPPRGLDAADLATLFPADRFELLATGRSDLCTNIRFDREQPVTIPALYGLLASI